jgi:DNA-binding NarL/FixJ family response regulator
MPEMNGVQLARAVKEKWPDLPVILLTGFGEEMQAQGHHPEYVDMVLAKPVSSTELRRAVCLAMTGQCHTAQSAEEDRLLAFRGTIAR